MIFIYASYISSCNSEKMVKIGVYLPKLAQINTGIRFLEHPVESTQRAQSQVNQKEKVPVEGLIQKMVQPCGDLRVRNSIVRNQRKML